MFLNENLVYIDVYNIDVYNLDGYPDFCILRLKCRNAKLIHRLYFHFYILKEVLAETVSCLFRKKYPSKTV